MPHNGPAVGFSKRNPTSAPPRICPGRPQSCHGARRVWRGFWHPGTDFNEDYVCLGTRLTGARKLSRCRIIIKGTCAVSRYNFGRSQKTVTVQDLNCVQMSVSGYMNYYKFVLRAGAIKNRDKLIDPTVRVSCCLIFLLQQLFFHENYSLLLHIANSYHRLKTQNNSFCFSHCLSFADWSSV